MTIGSVLLGMALLVLVGLFLAHPFLSPQEDDEDVALTEQQLLLEEKEALLDQIQVVDFDHDTGKIPTELHTYQRAQLVEQATAVLQALDKLGGTATPHTSPEAASSFDIEIEAAIVRLRQSPDAVSPVHNGQAQFCSQCGNPIDLGDKFCAYCGISLTLTTSTTTA